MNHSMYKLDQGVKIRITEKKKIKVVVMAEPDLRPIAGLVLWYLGSPRRGSWIDADWFPKALKAQASSGVWGHVPQGNFWAVNSPKTGFQCFWVIWTGYLLIVQTMFQFSTCEVLSFYYKCINFIVKNLTNFGKTVQNGIDPRLPPNRPTTFYVGRVEREMDRCVVWYEFSVYSKHKLLIFWYVF